VADGAEGVQARANAGFAPVRGDPAVGLRSGCAVAAVPLAQPASLGLDVGAGWSRRPAGLNDVTIVVFADGVFSLMRRRFSYIEYPARKIAGRPGRCRRSFRRVAPLGRGTIDAMAASRTDQAASAVTGGSNSDPSPRRAVVSAEEHLTELGGRIRSLRAEQGLTLQTVAERTGLSSSMVSMVERGRTSPSIGTLVAIASALGVHMADLFELEVDGSRDAVQRAAEHQVVETANGVLRRLVQVDPRRGVELVVNEYAPGTASAVQVTHHGGYEYGYVLEGVLTVELQNAVHHLEPGDSIAFESTRPHRIVNDGTVQARAVWVNLSSRGQQPDIGADGTRTD
jgi:transcriptional regulator with XRE-family HTH domain